MKDFTLNIYKEFLHILLKNDSDFLPFKNYINLSIDNHQSHHGGQASIIILRHDADRLPANALQMAKLESEMGIKGTYYFRIVRESYDEQVMKEIAELGHEIGYHYEDVDLVVRSQDSGVRKILRQAQGDNLRLNNNNEEMDAIINDAWESFKRNLEKMRNIADIKTICMHGSPRSKYDNKIIWEKYNYMALGIIGEPYFDIDFDEFAYFTDTGRRWNGNNVSVRDKVTSRYNFNFKTTREIIDNIDKLPDKMMFTIHPERWNDNIISWTSEFLSQNLKNIVKGFIVSRSKN